MHAEPGGATSKPASSRRTPNSHYSGPQISAKLAQSLTQRAAGLRIEEVFPECGPVAQLGARFHGMEEVIGSIPIRSTNNPPK